MLDVIDEVPGAAELIRWFGSWPAFHDAEVLDLELHRTGCSMLRIHTFYRTDDTDNRGNFICIKHVLVTFVLQRIKDLHLEDFSHQNVISGLHLTQTAEGYELNLEGCYGIQGKITANCVHIEFESGVPADSHFRNLAGQ